MKILVAEPVAPAAVDLLKAQSSWDIVVADPKTYQDHLSDTDALIVRSAVKVNADVLKKAPKLRAIGRAGVGVDNVDLDAATAAGVLVMNTPGGNAVAVAEHTLALMLSMARYIPQASASTKAGKWEKKKFLGHELRGKILGVIGLGSIGREVVRRARVFDMKVIAYDPYVSTAAAGDMGIELVSLNDLYKLSDYITLHVALTTETMGMLNDDAFAQMKKGVRVVNCARGELIDGAALCRALEKGIVADAALDVFQVEPPAAGEPLFAFEHVIATPHIGGATEEAQEIVGIRIVEQLIEYLKNGVALNAVNVPALTAEQYKAMAPYIDLAERLGVFVSHLSTGNPASVRLVYSGRLAEQNTTMVRNAGLAGVLSRSAAVRPNVVNAPQIAAERGLTITETHESRSAATDTIRLELATDQGLSWVEGAVVLGKPRLIQVDGIRCEAGLEGNLMFLKNEDVPGVIGFVGGVTGKNGINIASFSLGRQERPSQPGATLEAVAVVATDDAVPEKVLQQLLENPAIKKARAVGVSL